MPVVFGARRVGDIDLFKGLDALRGRGLVVQLFDAGKVIGGEHLLSAVEHAERAFERGSQTAKSLDVEVLLYASGERQIERAIKHLGISDCTQAIAGVIIGCGEGELPSILDGLQLERDDSVLEPSVDKLIAFGIDKREIDAVGQCHAQELVLERVALLDVKK